MFIATTTTCYRLEYYWYYGCMGVYNRVFGKGGDKWTGVAAAMLKGVDLFWLWSF